MSARFTVVILICAQLFACAVTPKQAAVFAWQGRDYLYANQQWSFAGRLAIIDQRRALSASISWHHHNQQDVIELAGPLGQGRTRIELSNSKIIVDKGGERVHYLRDGDTLATQLLGVKVPVSALRFWVLGLVFPEQDFRIIEQGFWQAGWQVKYLQMQSIGGDELPRKINIENERVRLKLVIDRWQL